MRLLTAPPDRPTRIAHLAHALAGLYSGPPDPSPTLGGRRAALERLGALDVAGYARARNDVVRRGVSALSAHIRHGALGIAELRDHVLTRFGDGPGPAKFVNELGWRAFYQQVYAAIGDDVHQDIHPPRFGRDRWSPALPADVAAGATGLACIDESLGELFSTGYMHNHARMWLAAYLVHWRGVGWRAGADLLYRHLLDGDPASNSLSWQWVAGTFSRKPYFFNRQNVERFSGGAFCQKCPLAAGGCPFDDSYERLSQRLFGAPLAALERGGPPDDALSSVPAPPPPESDPGPPGGALVWLHGDSLGPRDQALLANPAAPALFVFDEEFLGQAQLSFKRLLFIYECALEAIEGRDGAIGRGQVTAALLARAAACGATSIHVTASVAPRFRSYVAELRRHLPVVIHSPQPLASWRGGPPRSFSAYWRKAQAEAMRPTAAGDSR